MQPVYFAFLASLLALGHAGPIQLRGGQDQRTCAKICTENHKFNYRQGIIYQYDYSATASTLMNGASSDEPTISIRAKVEIEPVSNCDLIMRITEVKLLNVKEASQSTHFQEALTAHSLRFAFQDGIIESVCPQTGELTWVLNIKRGILSGFQNSMDRLDRDVSIHETDVTGTCLTTYNMLESNDKTMTIEKQKDLLSCTDRESFHNAMQSIKYNSHSNVNSLPLLKSNYKCQQTLDASSNILQKSECTEEQIFRPFSNGNGGAMSKVTQTLIFANIGRPTRAAAEGFGYRTTLAFAHEHGMVNQRETEQEIRTNLLDFCRNMDPSIGEGFTEKMNDLVEYIRQADYDTLRKVYNTLSKSSFCQKNPERTKKYYFDAIPMAGTTASVKMMQDLISMKHVRGTEAQVWLLSLSFIHHPSKDMVAAIMPLLDDREISENAILPVSSLASAYCSRNPKCGNDVEIENLVRKLLQFVGNCDNADDMKMMLALRALGNVGHSTRAVSRLAKCFTQRNNPMTVRVSAIEAFRHMSCDAGRSELMGVFNDITEDSEIRINAYIILMRCPSDMLVKEIRRMLEHEKSNQVGSFVWSHLTNLMETSDPHRQQLQSILEDEELKKEFDLDKRTSSKNYEKSVFFESFNAGAKAESNVIFSDKSFVPRSANLNLTVDLFGHAINLVELGGRVEGTEKYLEKYFSQHAMTKHPENDERDKMYAAFYMRVFGNEIMFKKMEPRSMSLLGNVAKSLFKTAQFVDSRMTVPTCIGLPLNLTVMVTGGLDYEGRQGFVEDKFRAGLKLSAELQVRGLMSVTAHYTNIGLKMVTSGLTSTGAEITRKGKMINFKLQDKKTEFINVKTEFFTLHDGKAKKQELIADDVHRSKICSGEALKAVTGLRFCQEFRYTNASTHRDAPFFPFTGPAVYNFYMKNEDAPNDYVMEAVSNGPNFRWSIDTPRSKTNRKTILEFDTDTISFSTPWKNIKMQGTFTNGRSLKVLKGQVSSGNKMHKMLAQLEMEYTRASFKFVPKFILSSEYMDLAMQGNLDCVYNKRADFDASITGSQIVPISVKVSAQNLLKGSGATIVVKRGKKEYSVIARLGKLPKKSGFKYSPYIKVTKSNVDLLESKGEVNYDGKSKGSLMLKLDKVSSKPISLNLMTSLNTGKNKNKQLFKMSTKTPFGSGKVNIDFEKRAAGTLSRVVVAYTSLFGKWSDQLQLTSKTRVARTQKASTYYGNAVLVSKLYKERNFNLKAKLTRTTGHSDVNVDLVYGNPKYKAINNVKFNAAFNYKFKPIARELTFSMLLENPHKNINVQTKGSVFYTHTWPLRKVESDLQLKYSQNGLIKAGLLYSNVKVKNLRKSEAKLSLNIPRREMLMEVKLDQVNPNTYKHSASVQWQKGQRAGMQTMLKHTPQVSQLESTVDFPNNKNAKLTVSIDKNDNDYKGSSSFHADQGIITERSIDVKVKSDLKYSISRSEISGDMRFELESNSLKKFSLTANHLNMLGQKSSTKIDLKTPFKALESYSDIIEQTFNKKQFSYSRKTQYKSNGNENDIKIDMSYNSMIPEFDCTYHSSINNVASDMELSFKNNANKKNAMFKLKHDKPAPLVFIKMNHARDRRQVSTDASLMFDMFNSNGNVKFAMHSDDREITSSGDVKGRISGYNLESTYSLKHNDAESSVDLDYTFSSRNNQKQGSISTVLTRSTPRNMKVDVTVTLNNRPQLKMVVNGVRSKENIDVNAEVTGPNAKKVTGSFNLNLSGTRKTSHAEIKSDSNEIAFDAAIEFRSKDDIDIELQSGLNGKNVVFSGNYKRDSSNYKINANLGLPDSRQIKMQTSFNNAAKKSFSFNVESPDFPSVTMIDMNFMVQPEYENFMVETSVKILPYLEKSQLNVDWTGDKMEASGELETPFESMRQAKVMVSLEMDGKKFDTINVKTFLNSKKFASFKTVYNIRRLNDFAVKIIGSTPHRKYNEFLFDITHKGDWMDFETDVEMKAGNIFTSKSALKNGQHNTDLDFNMNMGDKTWMGKFVRNKSDMTMKSSYKIRQNDQYTMDMMTNGKQSSLQLTAPEGKEFNADMTINPDDIHFNLETSLQLEPRNNYKFLATYDHMSKLHLKFSTPSNTGELMMTFSGTWGSFDYQADLTHNNNKYGVTVLNNNNKLFKATVTTPLVKSKMDLTKNSGWDIFSMNLEAKHQNLDTKIVASIEKDQEKINVNLIVPACEIQFYHDKDIKKGMVRISGRNTKFELNYKDKSPKPKNLDFTLSTPKHNLAMKINFDVQKSGIDGNVVTTYNGKKFNLDGSYETMGQKKIFKAGLKTEVSNYNMTTTFTGKMKKFKLTVKCQLNDKIYEATLSNKVFKTLNLFVQAPDSRLKMDFEGELQKFKFQSSMNMGKNQWTSSISNENYWEGLVVEVAIRFENYEMKYYLKGDRGSMLFNTQLLWRQNEYTLSLQGDIGTHSYSLSTLLPWLSLKANIMNGFQSSNMETKVIFSHGTYGLAAQQDRNNFNMTITLPGKQKLDIVLTKTSAMLRLQTENDVHECYLTFDKQVFRVNFSSFDNKGEMKAKFNDYMRDFTVNAQLSNKRNTHKLEAMYKKNKQMKFHVTMPDGKMLNFQSGYSRNAQEQIMRTTLKYGEYSGEYNSEWVKDEGQGKLRMKLKLSSRKTVATFDYNLLYEAERKTLTHSLDIDINDRKSSLVLITNLSDGLDASVVIEDPYTGKIELKVNAKPLKFGRIKSTWMLSSQLTGDMTLNYEHALTKTSFTSKGDIQSDNYKFVNYDMEINFPDRTYDIKMDYKNGKYNVNSKGSLADHQKTFSIQAKTPYRYLRDVTFVFKLYANRMAEVSVTFPRQFYAAKMNWNNDKLTTEIDLHMDRMDKLSQFKIIMTYVNSDDRSTVYRQTTFKVTQGDIVLTTEINFKKSYGLYMFQGEFLWGEEDNERVGAELHLRTAEKKEVSLILKSFRRDSAVTCTHESGRDRRNIMCTLMPDTSKKNNKIEIDADIFNYDNKRIFDITMKLPNQDENMKLKIVANGRNGNNLFSVRTQLSVGENARKTLTMETKLNNDNGNYTLNVLFEHPYSNFALEMMAFATAPQHKYSTGMELKYLTSERRQERIMLRADIDKYRREFNINLDVPKKQHRISGFVNMNDKFTMTLKKEESGRKDMQATATVSGNGRSMFVEMNYDQDKPNKVFRMKGEVMNKKITMKAIRAMGPKVNKDGRIVIELRPSNVLFAHFIWNPDTLNELNDYCYAVMKHYGNGMKVLGERIAEFLSEEMSMKGELMQKAFSEPLDALTDFMSSEYNLFSNDFTKHAKKVREFYERDSFYVKSMHMSAMDFWDSMWDNYQRDIEHLWRQVQHFNTRMLSKLEEAKVHIDYYYRNFEQQYQIYKAKMSRKIDEMLHYIQEQYNNGFDHLRSLEEEIQMYINKFPVIVKRIRRQMKDYPLAKSVMENGEKMFNTLYEHVSTHPWAEYIRDIGSKVYQQAEWAFNYWQVKENLYSLKDKTMKHVRKELNMLADIFTNFNMKTLLFDPKNGEIVMEFHYKSLMMAYKYARSIKQALKSVNHVVQQWIDMLPTSYWSLSDIYYSLKYYSNMNHWLPPFTARASVFGSHIQTFDGKHIDYSSSCSHTLAYSRDNFKMVADYSPNKNQNRISTITFTTGHNEKLRILPNYRVMYNGKFANLPLNMRDAKVFRTNDIITVLGESGYTVEANPSAGFYAISVSGWYFNRVSGLLGTNNNEQFDDMLTSRKHLTFDVNEFAESWLDSVPCRSQNRAESHNVPVNSICYNFFNYMWSDFRNCFKQVNPEHFYKVCNSHMYAETSAKKALCDVFSYYGNACNSRGVYLGESPLCRRIGRGTRNGTPY